MKFKTTTKIAIIIDQTEAKKLIRAINIIESLIVLNSTETAKTVWDGNKDIGIIKEIRSNLEITK